MVFLGEYNWIREHAALVKDLLPVLYGAGVRSLGFEFALSASQADIDALLDAPVWDAEKARRITFAWNVIWGFQEYLDVYHAAWQLNRTLPPGAQPFRIVGLGVRQRWELIHSERDAENADVLSRCSPTASPTSTWPTSSSGSSWTGGRRRSCTAACSTRSPATRAWSTRRR